MVLVAEMRKLTNFIPCQARRRIVLEKLESELRERQLEAIRALPPPGPKRGYYGGSQMYKSYGKN